jgi:phosphatidyl-myo-inositol dimannoside synthase
MRHILLTNDFPPKVGGIQSYLWELWRRLPPDDVTVFTASYPGATWWDREQKFHIVRAKEPVLLPQPHLAHRVREVARSVGADAVVIDPALPLGLIGPSLGLPYAIVLHGAEVTVPGRFPVSRQLLARTLRHASLVIAAGGYPEAEARRAVDGPEDSRPGATEGAFPISVQIPPGVDIDRFRPLPQIERAAARARLKLPVAGPLVVSVSRLVPRKGMDTLIEAASTVSSRFPGLSIAIAGAGRDRRRLERIASHANVRVDLLGKLSGADLPDFYACGDVFALCCRSRWWGLEQEGFGIVLVEAAAAGVPCITIDSGGAGEAVRDGETGIVAKAGDEGDLFGSRKQHAEQTANIAEALATLLRDPELARSMGEAGRRRAEEELSYDSLAAKLGDAINGMAGPTSGPVAISPAPDMVVRDGPNTMGATAPGPVTDGPVTDGPVTDGPVTDGTPPRGLPPAALLPAAALPGAPAAPSDGPSGEPCPSPGADRDDPPDQGDQPGRETSASEPHHHGRRGWHRPKHRAAGDGA